MGGWALPVTDSDGVVSRPINRRFSLLLFYSPSVLVIYVSDDITMHMTGLSVMTQMF